MRLIAAIVVLGIAVGKVTAVVSAVFAHFMVSTSDPAALKLNIALIQRLNRLPIPPATLQVTGK